MQPAADAMADALSKVTIHKPVVPVVANVCLLYTSDAADERSSVDLGGPRIIKKKKNILSPAHHS